MPAVDAEGVRQEAVCVVPPWAASVCAEGGLPAFYSHGRVLSAAPGRNVFFVRLPRECASEPESDAPVDIVDAARGHAAQATLHENVKIDGESCARNAAESIVRQGREGVRLETDAGGPSIARADTKSGGESHAPSRPGVAILNDAKTNLENGSRANACDFENETNKENVKVSKEPIVKESLLTNADQQRSAKEHTQNEGIPTNVDQQRSAKEPIRKESLPKNADQQLSAKEHGPKDEQQTALKAAPEQEAQAAAEDPSTDESRPPRLSRRQRDYYCFYFDLSAEAAGLAGPLARYVADYGARHSAFLDVCVTHVLSDKGAASAANALYAARREGPSAANRPAPKHVDLGEFLSRVVDSYLKLPDAGRSRPPLSADFRRAICEFRGCPTLDALVQAERALVAPRRTLGAALGPAAPAAAQSPRFVLLPAADELQERVAEHARDGTLMGTHHIGNLGALKVTYTPFGAHPTVALAHDAEEEAAVHKEFAPDACGRATYPQVFYNAPETQCPFVAPRPTDERFLDAMLADNVRLTAEVFAAADDEAAAGGRAFAPADVYCDVPARLSFRGRPLAEFARMREVERAAHALRDSSADERTEDHCLEDVDLGDMAELDLTLEGASVYRPRPGFCECCQERYPNLMLHVQRDKHRRLARDSKFYDAVDAVIALIDASAEDAVPPGEGRPPAGATLSPDAPTGVRVLRATDENAPPYAEAADDAGRKRVSRKSAAPSIAPKCPPTFALPLPRRASRVPGDDACVPAAGASADTASADNDADRAVRRRSGPRRVCADLPLGTNIGTNAGAAMGAIGEDAELRSGTCELDAHTVDTLKGDAHTVDSALYAAPAGSAGRVGPAAAKRNSPVAEAPRPSLRKAPKTTSPPADHFALDPLIGSAMAAPAPCAARRASVRRAPSASRLADDDDAVLYTTGRLAPPARTAAGSERCDVLPAEIRPAEKTILAAHAGITAAASPRRDARPAMLTARAAKRAAVETPPAAGDSALDADSPVCTSPTYKRRRTLPC